MMGKPVGFSRQELNYLSVLSLLDDDDIANLSNEAADEIVGALNLGMPTGADIRTRKPYSSVDDDEEETESCEEDDDARRQVEERIFQDDNFTAAPVRKDHAHYPYLAARNIEPELWDAFEKSAQPGTPLIMLKGARGSGKSTLWRARMAGSQRFSDVFDLSLTIDCFSLRSRSFGELELDAMFALAEDDDAFQGMVEGARKLQAFIQQLEPQAELGDDETPDDLTSLFARSTFEPGQLRDLGLLGTVILARFGYFNLKRPNLRGIVAFDHVECLSDAREVRTYFRKLCSALQRTGIAVLLISSNTERADLAALEAQCSIVELGPLLPEEIEAFWQSAPFTQVREAGLSAGQVRALVGGSPRLLRDLCRFIADRADWSVARLARGFHRSVSAASMPEIARLDAALMSMITRRKAAATLRRSLANRPFWVDSRSGRKLCATGAVRAEGTEFAFISRSIHFAARRYLSGEGRLWLSCLPSEDELVRNFPKFSTVPPRFLLDLVQDIRHKKVFARTALLLNGFGLADTSFWLRDPANAKLWACVFAQSREHTTLPSCNGPFWNGNPEYWVPQPLYGAKNPEIAMALKNGRIVSKGSGATVLPIVGDSGRISTLILGRAQWSGALDARQKQRTIWMLAQALQPAIALAEERMHVRRADTIRRARRYRSVNRLEKISRSGSSDTQEIFQNLLQQAGCSAVVVLERGPFGWSVRHGTGVRTQGVGDQSVRWRQFFEPAGDKALDEICDHYSGKPIVKTGADIIDIFPRLGSFEQAGAFICPSVETSDELRRLIVFGSVETGPQVGNDRPNRPVRGISIEGEDQQHMLRLAALASAAC